MSTPTFPAPQIDGNQGVFFYSASYDTSAASSDTFDIHYADLNPSASTTPNLLITSASLLVFGPQVANGGTSFLKLERPDSDTSMFWKFLCECRDGQFNKTENYNPGIRLTHANPAEQLCFQAFWQAYASAPNSFGQNGTERYINIQVVYTLEGA